MLVAKPRFSSKFSPTIRLTDQSNAVTCRVPETLSQEILTMVKAPPKPDYPIMTIENLPNFDGYLFGIPTRYGNMPVQWKVLATSVSASLC